MSAVDTPSTEKDGRIHKDEFLRFRQPTIFKGKIIKSTLKGDQFWADCDYDPKARSQHVVFPFKVNKQSLLLRAEQNGQFTKITLDDLFKQEQEVFMWLAAVEEDGSKEPAGRIFWFILYPEGVKSPPLPKRDR